MRVGPVRLLAASLLALSTQLHAAAPQYSARVSIASGLQQLTDVTTADFNGDGKIDIAVIDRLDRKVVVYLNKGNGTFGTPVVTTLTLGGTTGNLVVGDVNEDGKQDLIVGTVSGGDQQDLLLLGNGDGTFMQKGMLPGSYGFASGKLIDVNNDSHLDLLVSSGTRVECYLGDGHGGFSLAPVPDSGPSPSNLASIAIADFNRDGKVDVVAGSLEGNGALPTNNLRFFAGTGDGTFQAPSVFTGIVNETPSDLSAADLNGDGRPDLVFSVPNIAVVAFGNGDGTFQASSKQFRYLPVPVFNGVSTVYFAPPVALADMDKDGTIDAVVIDPDTSTVNVDLNTDGLGDFPDDPDFSASVPMGSSRLQLADVNGDGLPDIIATSYQTNEISIFLSILPKTTPTITLSGGGAPVLTSTAITITAKVAGTPVPTGTVTLYNGSTVVSTQLLDSTGQATFANIVFSTGTHAISAAYSGDARYNTLPSTAAAGLITQHIVDATIALPAPAQTVSSGAPASFPVAITSTADFTGTVVLTCAGLPASFTCPAVNATGAAATVVVTPPGTVASAARPARGSTIQLACLLAGLCVLPVAGKRRIALLIVLFGALTTVTITGCSSNSTPAATRYTGTTNFTITATVTQGSTTATRTAPATLIVQ